LSASTSIAADQLTNDDTEELLRRYFSLNLDLGALYDQWSKADANFQKKAPAFQGVRILGQDAWEALICFICSSNNNISRISQMVGSMTSTQIQQHLLTPLQVHKLCNHYGPLIGYVDGEAMHDFPSPEALTGKTVEAHLRELGFGYRAKYIADTARVVALEKPSSWLESLRNPKHDGLNVSSIPSGTTGRATYKEAHEALLSLTGVGPKVADCVCLMGLGWGESVPVDTHVWQIAQRDYKFGKSKVKTLNKATYDAVGDHFRSIWGDYAGWAHSVLFTADLKEFSSRKEKTEVPAPAKVKSEILEEQLILKVDTEAEDLVNSKLLEKTTIYKRRKTRGS
jgi:N-glycosylase/DNA lyase